MNTLLVTYDLHRPGQSYTDLIEYLKSFGTWWHHLQSTWLVKTPLTASALRSEIVKRVDGNDEVLVVNVTGDAWASWGLSDNANSWLKTNI